MAWSMRQSMRSQIGVTGCKTAHGDATDFPESSIQFVHGSKGPVTTIVDSMIDIDHRRDTKEAAAFLTNIGYRTAPATLTKLRCIGGGPQFESFGRRPLYRESDLLAWVAARTLRQVQAA